MVALANKDPITKCALPIMQSQALQIKQLAAQIYPEIAQQTTAYVQNVVQPAVVQNMRAMIRNALQASAGTQTSGRQKQYPAMKRTLNRTQFKDRVKPRRALPKARTATGNAKPVKPGLRVRAAGTFMDKSVQAAKGVAQAGIGFVQNVASGAVPDKITLIALGEFTTRALSPAVLDSATNELGTLSSTPVAKQ